MGMGLPIGVILNQDKEICSGKTSIISAKLAECPLGMKRVRLGEKRAEVPTCPTLPTSQLSGQVRPRSQDGSRHKTGQPWRGSTSGPEGSCGESVGARERFQRKTCHKHPIP